jgi:uncharacterized repeat protein (TIGR03803 family)
MRCNKFPFPSTAGNTASDGVFRGNVLSTVVALIIVFLATLTAAHPAFAQTDTILYDFCSLSNCADGVAPSSALSMDASGNFYGVTQLGGTFNEGTLYQLSPDGTVTVLHTFGSVANDGIYPFGNLFMDSEGNLYGGTAEGGANNGGILFKVTPEGAETILYNFCSMGGSECTDGSVPVGGFVRDSHGNFYGTTEQGGAHKLGTVFRLTPGGIETVLHSFGNGTDGATPEAGLVMDSAGNIYGTTAHGGVTLCSEGCGAVFKMTLSGTMTLLYSFCAGFSSPCRDGIYPLAAPVLDSLGNLYGTTEVSGLYNYGTVFRISRSGTDTLLHQFAGHDDGENPVGGLIFDSAGYLYGTTLGSGSDRSDGIVFKMSSTSRTGKETILHSFRGGNVDGSEPEATLLMDSAGNLYGTTVFGGNGSSSSLGDGAVFKVTP